jgi:YHS domain-containing protein
MRAILLCCALASVLFLVPGVGASPNEVPWITDPYQARQLAQQQQRLLLMHFYSDSCPPCRKLDRDVFPRPEVIKAINASYVAAKINAERFQEVARQCQVDRYPTDVIIDSTGRTVFRGVTPQDPLRYAVLLDRVAAESRPSNQVLASTSQRQESPRSTLAPPMADRPVGPYQAAYAGTTNDGATDRSGQGAIGPWAGAYPPAPSAREWASDRVPRPAVSSDSTSESGYGVTSPPRRGNDDYDRTPNGPPTAQPPESSSRAQVNFNPYVKTSGMAASGDRNASFPAFPPESNPTTSRPDAPGTTGRDDGRMPLPAGPASYAMSEGAFRGPGGTYADLAQRPTPVERRESAAANTVNSDGPGGLPLGLDGFCPVTLAEEQRWQRGDPRSKGQHRDQDYCFASPKHRDKFLTDPDRYTPVLCGYDSVRFLDTGEAIPGKRQHGMWYKDMIYLFADEISLERFAKAPEFYAQKSQEAMLKSCR